MGVRQPARRPRRARGCISLARTTLRAASALKVAESREHSDRPEAPDARTNQTCRTRRPLTDAARLVSPARSGIGPTSMARSEGRESSSTVPPRRTLHTGCRIHPRSTTSKMIMRSQANRPCRCRKGAERADLDHGRCRVEVLVRDHVVHRQRSAADGRAMTDPSDAGGNQRPPPPVASSLPSRSRVRGSTG
jgi:hypothetical protein